jgi:ribonuclease P/MRP protein subunit POP5
VIKIIKIKTLSPTLREKKRYLVYEIISNKKFMFNDVKNSIDSANLRFLGELGLAKAGIIHLEDAYNNNKGIMRVNNKYINELKMSLSLIKSINNDKTIVNTLYVSGMLNKSKKISKKGG